MPVLVLPIACPLGSQILQVPLLLRRRFGRFGVRYRLMFAPKRLVLGRRDVEGVEGVLVESVPQGVGVFVVDFGEVDVLAVACWLRVLSQHRGIKVGLFVILLKLPCLSVVECQLHPRIAHCAIPCLLLRWSSSGYGDIVNNGLRGAGIMQAYLVHVRRGPVVKLRALLDFNGVPLREFLS